MLPPLPSYTPFNQCYVQLFNSPMLKGLENIEDEISEVCLKSPKRKDVENINEKQIPNELCDTTCTIP